MKPLLVVSLVLLLAACDALAPAQGDLRAADLTLTTDARVYASGDMVTLALRNDGDRTGDVGFLGCTPLERQTGGAWTTPEAGNGRFCPAVVVPLEPGETATAAVELDGVPAGTYRFALRVSDGAVTTAPFDVR